MKRELLLSLVLTVAAMACAVHGQQPQQVLPAPTAAKSRPMRTVLVANQQAYAVRPLVIPTAPVPAGRWVAYQRPCGGLSTWLFGPVWAWQPDPVIVHAQPAK